MTVQQPNLDPREIDRFAKMADDWWNPKGQFRPLHKIGPARIEFIRNCLTRHFGLTGGGIRPLKGLRLLDVGCGGGLIAEPLARLGAEVTGIDPGEDTVAAARIHAAQQGVEIDYRATTIETLEATGEKFDVVTALEVVEHVPEPAAFLATCTRVLEPGGVLIASTINRTAKSYALAIVAAEYVLQWLPRGTHDWNRFITVEEMRSALEEASLDDIRFEGIVFDPLRDRWHLSSDTDVNYIVSASKPGE